MCVCVCVCASEPRVSCAGTTVNICPPLSPPPPPSPSPSLLPRALDTAFPPILLPPPSRPSAGHCYCAMKSVKRRKREPPATACPGLLSLLSLCALLALSPSTAAGEARGRFVEAHAWRSGRTVGGKKEDTRESLLSLISLAQSMTLLLFLTSAHTHNHTHTHTHSHTP